jgi:hypothetical protein
VGGGVVLGNVKCVNKQNLTQYLVTCKEIKRGIHSQAWKYRYVGRRKIVLRER